RDIRTGQRRIVAEVGLPLIARALPPLGKGCLVVALKVGAATAVDAHEVRDDRLIVELALARQLPGQPDMLDVVAENAERAESIEMLDVRRVVVAPDLVAVQHATRAADTAAIAG